MPPWVRLDIEPAVLAKYYFGCENVYWQTADNDLRPFILTDI